MLLQLTIRNIAIIREVQVEFGPGFTALTGETGAGKSILIDALGLVLGARASSDLVRSGASRAWVEAIFDVSQLSATGLAAALAESGIVPEDDQLILSREVQANGRSIARVNGQAVPAGVLATIGAALVDIHGQSDHLSLLKTERQLELLDRFGGLLPLRSELARAVREFRATLRELDQLRAQERDRAHRIDFLRYQLQEITGARLRPDEEEELQRERARLQNAERLAMLAAEVVANLDGEDDTPLDALRRASLRLEELARLDPDQQGLVGQLREALYSIEDVVRTMRVYAETVESDPDRLAAIEDRLELLRRLKRKYGATVEEILSYAERARRELETLESSDERIAELEARAEALAAEVVQRAEELSQRRRRAAVDLERAMSEAMRALRLGQGRFTVLFDDSARLESIVGRAATCSESGWDRAEFLIAPNPGQEPRPLARIASGGEMARLMLALKSILSEVDETPTLVFDEVDVGIGSRSAQVVGERLWELAQRHQVIVISHLPQIAAFADRHYKITKHVEEGTTETLVHELRGEARLEELAAMMDGVPITPESLANARAMVERVEQRKAALAGIRVSSNR
ncbi:DNA repair protein RecN [Thermomicrobium sp. CFH 73360]|uniref:DNA repair protein RecN n=1 Tax=Thermomicrobium sp. CFH 73360 TaxID=2951987 RepID=UPI0020770F54|nr:DNA repair protein RecN [Thermomicrobium sp. CFH 73360]MCM8747209.1 DNA repair protein RecN [Thermomicrobium sp. CFH 73360]